MFDFISEVCTGEAADYLRMVASEREAILSHEVIHDFITTRSDYTLTIGQIFLPIAPHESTAKKTEKTNERILIEKFLELRNEISTPPVNDGLLESVTTRKDSQDQRGGLSLSLAVSPSDFVIASNISSFTQNHAEIIIEFVCSSVRKKLNELNGKQKKSRTQSVNTLRQNDGGRTIEVNQYDPSLTFMVLDIIKESPRIHQSVRLEKTLLEWLLIALAIINIPLIDSFAADLEFILRYCSPCSVVDDGEIKKIDVDVDVLKYDDPISDIHGEPLNAIGSKISGIDITPTQYILCILIRRVFLL